MKYKTTLIQDRNRRRSKSPILIGIGIIAIVVIIWILIPSGEEEEFVPSKHIDAFDMTEFVNDDELSRQSFDVLEGEDAAASSLAPGDVGDPFLIKNKIRKKQTLFLALKSHDLDQGDIQQLISSLQNVIDFRKTKPGDKYEVHLDSNRRIVKFIYEISPEDISIAERDGGSFIAQKVDVHKVVEDIHVKGELKTSLYDAFVSIGESGELASKFMALFKYDIDFGTSSQAGDKFSVFVEKITLNGKFYRYGRLYAATYYSRALGRELSAYYFNDTKDTSLVGYYDENGRTIKRIFLKTPVIGCKMTSPFDPKRMHPVLKRVRPHNGIDWAGQTGTHVLAFGDGVVTTAEWKGGNGNLLVIQHDHGYVSMYAHLYAFALGIKKGVKVKQGQYVAQVGSTGLSTGPHLHFAVKKDGKYIDPLSIDTAHAFSLSGRDLSRFYETRNKYKTKMEETVDNNSAPEKSSEVEGVFETSGAVVDGEQVQ